jgi:hypothetical protein
MDVKNIPARGESLGWQLQLAGGQCTDDTWLPYGSYGKVGSNYRLLHAGSERKEGAADKEAQKPGQELTEAKNNLRTAKKKMEDFQAFEKKFVTVAARAKATPEERLKLESGPELRDLVAQAEAEIVAAEKEKTYAESMVQHLTVSMVPNGNSTWFSLLRFGACQAGGENCSSQCRDSRCASGDLREGGQRVSDFCTTSCSATQNQSGLRYCGAGQAFEGNVSVNCSQCVSCPFECKAPNCMSGDPLDGGEMAPTACKHRCSAEINGARQCGRGHHTKFEGAGSIDCSGCRSAQAELPCEYGVVVKGKSQLERLECPLASQRIAGWRIWGVNALEGIELYCADLPGKKTHLGPFDKGAGWVPCHGTCASSKGKAESCRDGTFLTSMSFQDDGFDSLLLVGGRCSDGSKIISGANYSCPNVTSGVSHHGAALAGPRGTSTWTLPATPGARLSFFSFDECAQQGTKGEGKCQLGWLQDHKRMKFKCPFAGQKLAGWHIHTGEDGCHIAGIEFYCSEVTQPLQVDRVTYCEPDSFKTFGKLYTDDRLALTSRLVSSDLETDTALIRSKCEAGFQCPGFLVTGNSGMGGVSGKYTIDPHQLSDGRPVFRMDDKHVISRHKGTWRIEVGAEVFYTAPGLGQAVPPSGRWEVPMDGMSPAAAAMFPPTVYCDNTVHSETPEDPCWTLHKQCQKRFLYKGRNYTGCTKVDSNQHWCGLADAVSGGKDWALCKDDLNCRKGIGKKGRDVAERGLTNNPNERRLCWQPAQTCQPFFFFNEKSYKGCTIDHNSGSHWCSEETHYQEGISLWKPCTQVSCDSGAEMNVALHRSILSSGGINLEVATDGVSPSMFDSIEDLSKCAQTEGGSGAVDSQSMRIDLKDPFQVSKLTLVKGPMEAVWRVTIGDRGDATDPTCIDGINASGTSLEVECGHNPPGPSSLTGRYLSIWSSSPIQLCEVQAMATACHRPHPECVQEFTKPDKPGEVFAGCTTSAGSKTPWCSRSEVFNGGFMDCEPAPCIGGQAFDPFADGEPLQLCVKPDPECVRDFTYKGITTNQCSSDEVLGNTKFSSWCSTTPVFDVTLAKGTQKPCSRVACDSCYIAHSSCTATFIYEEKNVSGCINVDSDGQFWCSTSASYSEKSERRFCTQCEPEVAAHSKLEYIDSWPSDPNCWKPTKGCVDQFTIDSRPHSGCTSTGSHQPWCSKDEFFKGRFQVCEVNPDGWRPSPNCVPEFQYKGEIVIGCKTTGYHVGWCSQTARFSGAWEECTKCAGEASEPLESEKCTKPDPTCKPSFVYDGLHFSGCTSVNSPNGSAWCSTVHNLGKGHPNWAYCLPPKKECLEAIGLQAKQAQGDRDRVVITLNIENLDMGKLNFVQQADLREKLSSQLANSIGGVDKSSVGVTLQDAAAARAADAAIAASNGTAASTVEIGQVQAVPGIRVVANVLTEHARTTQVKAAAMSSQTTDLLSSAVTTISGIQLAVDGKMSMGRAEAKIIYKLGEDDAQDAMKMTQAKCYRPHTKCQTQFVYGANTVTGCVKEGYHKNWCSPDAVFTGRFFDCTEVPCADCWQPLAVCARTFLYERPNRTEKQRISGCTNLDSDQHWCSLGKEFSLTKGNWAPCTPCSSHVEAVTEAATDEEDCYKPALGCRDNFTYEGQRIVGCTHMKSKIKTYWCSRVENFDGAPEDWLPCSHCDKGADDSDDAAGDTKVMAASAECLQPAKDCVSQFSYRGRLQQGCVFDPKGGHWCSKERAYTDGSDSFAVCSQVPCKKCWLRDDKCLESFQYQGETIYGCEQGMDGQPGWCSLDAVFSDFGGRWKKCDACDPFVTHDTGASSSLQVNTAPLCFKPTPACVPEFSYKGKLYAGCTKVDYHRHWCSRDRDLEEGEHTAFDVCQEVACDKCWLRAPNCLPTFDMVGKHGEVRVEGCSQDAIVPSRSWCSTSLFFKAGRSEWADCLPCQAPKREASSAGSRELDVCYKPSHSCQPGFSYENKLYSGCTGKDANMQWCSKDRVFHNSYGGFKQCWRVPCEECVVRDSACLQSFTYAATGEMVEGCTTSNWATAWCSLDETFVTGVSRWAECSPCSNSKNQPVRPPRSSPAGKCYKPHAACATGFYYKGKFHRGCTKADSQRAWCSRSRYYEGLTDGKELCDETACDQCFLRAPMCKTSFSYQGNSYNGCTNVSSDSWWCSKDTDFKADEGRFASCTPCEVVEDPPKDSLAVQKCFKAHSACKQSFVYKNVTYHGCTKVDSDNHWCGKDAVMNEEDSRFDLCAEVPCDLDVVEFPALTENQEPLCNQPTPRCVPEFTMNGVVYRGCMESTGSSRPPWCSMHATYKGVYDYCTKVPCSKCWLRSASCLPESEYEGAHFSGCTKMASDQQWCSKDAIFTRDFGRWSACEPCEVNLLEENEKACWEPDLECQSRFLSEGKLVTGCTKDGRCALGRSLGDESESRSCTTRKCKGCFLVDPQCKTRWMFENQTYTGCTSVAARDGSAWCSEDSIYVPGTSTFHWCDRCRHAPASKGLQRSGPECFKPDPLCVQPFFKDGKAATGCIKEQGHQKAWCSRVEHYDDTMHVHSHSWAWCTPTPCEEVCWQPTAGCKQPFSFNGLWLSGCINEGAGSLPWCSKELEIDESTGSRELCKQVSCKDVCHKVHSSCKQPFLYNGVNTTGCVQEDGVQPWCSTADVFENGSTQWRICEQASCDNACSVKAKECAQSFKHEGKNVSGCVAATQAEKRNGTHSSWCLRDAADPTSRSLCGQVDCQDVCYKRPSQCLRSFTYKGETINGCLKDPKVLQGDPPFCSSSKIFDEQASERITCEQIACHEADCEGPACKGFGILKLPDQRCVTAGGRNSEGGFSLVVAEGCRFPDYWGFMVKEEPTHDGYFLIKDFSGRCLHSANVGKKKRALLVQEVCTLQDKMKFRRVAMGNFHFLQHHSGLCVDVSDNGGEASSIDPEVLVLSDNCPEEAFKQSNTTIDGALALLAGDVSEANAALLKKPILRFRHFPRECTWGAWSEWTPCSKTCGEATTYRNRPIGQQAERGGAQCRGLKHETISCSRACPIHCVLGDWGTWGACTKACGGGEHFKKKEILVQPKFGGRACKLEQKSLKCNEDPCPKPCVWGEWLSWGACSASCGGGTQSRKKPVLTEASLGGSPCSKSMEMVRTCGATPCPVHCALGPWNPWTACTKTCGEGEQMRSRNIMVQAMFRGKECGNFPVQVVDCAMAPCPVNCRYTDWTDWGACDVSCGGGKRELNHQEIAERYGGRKCSDDTVAQSATCNSFRCPFNCIWEPWTAWRPCSQTCGGGSKARYRNQLHMAQNGGKACAGSRLSRVTCNAEPCATDCTWDDWDTWSMCEKSCGGGLQTRSRFVLKKADSGGRECEGYPKQQQVCNKESCPLDCIWNEWTQFSACSITCNGGTKLRTRTKMVVDQHGGDTCRGKFEDLVRCGSDRCPVDCVWNLWGDWSTCSKPCGRGKKKRSRSIGVEAQNRGKACLGVPRADDACNMQSCPVNCVWNTWVEWTKCSRSCGEGMRNRERFKMQEAQHKGTKCSGPSREETGCNGQACPIDCLWYEWELWHTCRRTCGGGTRMRHREKRIKAFNGGRQCIGGTSDHSQCGMWICPINCRLGAWSPWSRCTKSCGGGVSTRERNVEIPGSAGGTQCRGDVSVYKGRRWCKTNPCPDDYSWMRPKGPTPAELAKNEREMAFEAQSAENFHAEAAKASRGGSKLILKLIVGAFFVFGIVGFCIMQLVKDNPHLMGGDKSHSEERGSVGSPQASEAAYAESDAEGGSGAASDES